jgi:hypothetical protein
LNGGSARHKAVTYTQNNTNRKNAHRHHAWSGIRNHEPSVIAGDEGSGLGLRGHCARPKKNQLPDRFRRFIIRNCPTLPLSLLYHHCPKEPKFPKIHCPRGSQPPVSCCRFIIRNCLTLPLSLLYDHCPKEPKFPKIHCPRGSQPPVSCCRFIIRNCSTTSQFSSLKYYCFCLLNSSLSNIKTEAMICL